MIVLQGQRLMILKEENVSSQVLDHLGLVTSVIKDIGLIEKIDQRIPVSKEKSKTNILVFVLLLFVVTVNSLRKISLAQTARISMI